MTARIGSPEFDQSRFDSAQIGNDHYKEFAQQVLIPRIIERSRQAISVDSELFQFYQRADTGRRCSCFSNQEVTASSTCLICFGSGNTDGYQLYGHRTEVLDVTAVSAAVNVVTDYTEITRPLSFRLASEARQGFIEYVMPVSGGINLCSLLSLHGSVCDGTSITAACRLFTESSWVTLTEAAVTSRLQQAQVTGGLIVRVMLARESLSTPSPKFFFLRIRYKLTNDDTVKADIPLSSESNRVSELGWFADVATQSMFLDNTLRRITSEDLFRSVRTGRLWRIVDITGNTPAGILTSWDVNIRIVQPAERFYSLP